MKLIKFFMVLIIITGLSMFPAEAPASTGASILYEQNDLGGGLWQYDYTFYNTSSVDLYKVALFFNGPVTVTGSPLTNGWVGTVWDGTYTTTFMNAMSQYSSGYIAAGSSLAGFSFTVDNQLGDIGFYSEFRDSASGSISTFTGTTAVVPEPVSTILFLTGGAVMAARNRFRRRKEIA